MGAGDGVDKLPGQGGDATHALQHVQDDALAGEDDARVVPHHGHLLSAVQAHAVKDFRMTGDLGVGDHGAVELGKDLEDAGDRAQPGQDAILFGYDRPGGALADVNASVGGSVAYGAVLTQCVLQDGGDATAV